MSFLGRYQLGKTVVIPLQCQSASRVPTLPDDAPWLTVLNSSGTVIKQLQIPILDRRQVTAFFQYPLFLGAGFSAGKYTAKLTYQASSHTGQEAMEFEIVAGGDVDGHVLAMHFYRRPHANFAVHQTESGRVKKGKNPYL